MAKQEENRMISRGQLIKGALAGVCFGLLAVFVLRVYFYLRYQEVLSVGERVKAVLSVPFYQLLFGIGFGSAAGTLGSVYGSKICDILYRFRYLFAVVLFVLLVALGLSGTSIGIYGTMLGLDPDQVGLLFGTYRGIRLDEAATLTPIMLSQYAGTAPFAYFSEIIRGTTTDVFLEYGAPVLDLAVVFRPFHWGFLFLSPARGLSFFWYGRLIALWMVSFEMGMLFGKGRKGLALLYSVMLTFSPVIQWWFAINGLVEMLVFGQGIILLTDRLLKTKSIPIKCLCALGIAVFAGGYLFTMYPAWMVVLAYVFFLLFVWVLVENRGLIKPVKNWLPYFAGAILLFGAGAAYVLMKSWDTVEAILSTVYPGSVVSQGGQAGDWAILFGYGGNLVFSVITKGVENVCGIASVFSLAPLGIAIFLYRGLRSKKWDLLSILLASLSLVFFLYLVTPFPAIIGKLTLLDHVSSGRMAEVMGVSDLILLFRQLTLMGEKQEERNLPLCLFGIALLPVLCADFVLYRDSFGLIWVILFTALAAMLFFLVYCFGRKSKNTPAFLGLRRVAFCGLLILPLVTGGMVNPIQKDLSVVYETDLMQAVKAIVSEDPDALWTTDGLGYIMNDYAIMGGAKCIDSINIYPNLELFRKLDPTGQYEEVYNRYAHILVNLQDEAATSFTLWDIRDGFTLNLAISDLSITGVKYVMTSRNLTIYSSEGQSFEAVAAGNGYTIYRVK